MPGLTARSANKNLSRAKRAAFSKNSFRIEGALTENLIGYCTYGKVTKCLGHKMFTVLTPQKREHLCHIRGNIAKAIRINIDDVVLLSIRDYETRATIANGVNAVYDIIASLDKKDVAKLIKTSTLPSWMNRTAEDAFKPDEDDLFDYGQDDDDEEEPTTDQEESTSNIVAKKDKKKHRSIASLAGGGGRDTSERERDIDIDAI